MALFDVTLQWTEGTEANLIGYQLFEGVASGGYDFNTPIATIPKVAAGQPIEHTLVDHPEGTFFWMVRPYDNIGLGPEGNEVTVELADLAPINDVQITVIARKY